MTAKLERGYNISLTKVIPKINNFYVELSWSIGSKHTEIFDIDGSCFLLAANKQVNSNLDFIFYNQPQDSNKAVILIEKHEETNQSSDKTKYSIDLSKLPSQISSLVFCLTIHKAEEKQQNFSNLDHVSLSIIAQATQEEVAVFQCNCKNELSKETAISVGEFYRHNNEWKFKAIGQGYNNGLTALAKTFGVSFEQIASTSAANHEKNYEQLIIKKKRRSSEEVIAEQIELIKRKMKLIMPQISTSSLNNISESNTRMVIDRIFQDILGYSIDEIKTEQKIQGRSADYILSPDGQDTVVIEAKRAGLPLRERQIFQATSYAAYAGIQWAILTNLVEWRLYKVPVFDKVDPHLVFIVDLNRGLDDENMYNMMLISKFGLLRRGLIEKVWLKRVCLKAETLIGAILNDDVISKIRSIIIKETNGDITNDEIKRAIETDVLKI